MARLTISEAARRDLSHVYVSGVTMFGLAQADRYIDELLNAIDLIAEFPLMARLRMEIAPPIRAHQYQSHVILYDVGDQDQVVIVRIRHALEDWQRVAGVAGS